MSRILVACGLLLGTALASCSTAGPPDAGSATPGALAAEGYVPTIPVLVFHQICTIGCATGDTYGVTQAEFTRMMLTIKGAGYRTISIADFVRAHGGDRTGLPQRPILVTFDDGRLDAYRGADDVLRELGLQATMFVMTAEVEREPHFRMQWPEIKQAAASGRWSIQLHAHAGHVRVPVGVDAAGAPAFGAFYGWRACASPAGDCAALESFTDWRQRAEHDIETGDARLASELGPAAYSSLSFAVPFSDYGQIHSNDPRIAVELRAFLDARFAVWFTQPSADPEFMMPSDSIHEVARYLVLRTTTAEAVAAWLAKHGSAPPLPPGAR